MACLPQYDVTPWVTGTTKWLKALKDAGVMVNAVWYDYEGLPYPWNWNYDAPRRRAAAQLYPAGALDSFARFHQYTLELAEKIYDQGMVAPVHALFPHALTGEYGATASSAAFPFVDENGAVYPRTASARLARSCPACTPTTPIYSTTSTRTGPWNRRMSTVSISA